MGTNIKECRKLDHGLVQGFHFIPAKRTLNGIVVTFGGSEGSCFEDKAEMIAELGVETFALYYFGLGDLPQQLEFVPLEFFAEFLIFLKRQKIKSEPLTLVGISRGAELVVLLTRYFSEVDNIVAYAPSAYLWPGLVDNKTPAWTWKGTPFPFMDASKVRIVTTLKIYMAMLRGKPYALLDIFKDCIKRDKREEVKLNVASFLGKMLLFAGDDDQLWPSAEMAQTLKMQNPEHVEIEIYPKAGHAFLPFLEYQGRVMGGNLEANYRAAIESDSKLRHFIIQQHSQNL